MAKYKVTGADKSTGITRIETITADTSEEAQLVAGGRGMMISGIEKLESTEVAAGGGINIVNSHHSDHGSRRSSRKTYDNGVAALLSFLLPGVGQMVKGQVAAGILWFIAAVVGYVLFVIPGLIIHICCIVDAARSDD